VSGTLTIIPGEPTSISFAAVTLYENAPSGTLAGTLSSTSDDPAAVFTYSLVSGSGSTDNALFNVSGNEIRTTTSLNFESKPIYAIRVRSTTQHNLSLDKELLIAINDVNEQPTLDDIANRVICYTPAEQSVSLSGVSAGPDAGQTTTLSVSSTNNSLFELLEVTPAINGNATIKYKISNGSFGNAVINVMVTDDGGTANAGINTLLKSFILQVNQLPVLSLSSGKGTELSKGEVTVLKAEVTAANNGLTYSWANANGILSGQSSQNLTVRPSETTTYKVSVTNVNGCKSEKEITITVKADYIGIDGVNILTPNGDGVNDRLVIKNLDMYPNHEVKIFDRAGRLIYNQKNYTDQWDGSLNGSILAEDTYYYVVDFGPGIDKKKGFITIVKDK
jgi:gliding motility-associated-like protein